MALDSETLNALAILGGGRMGGQIGGSPLSPGPAGFGGIAPQLPGVGQGVAPVPAAPPIPQGSHFQPQQSPGFAFGRPEFAALDDEEKKKLRDEIGGVASAPDGNRTIALSLLAGQLPQFGAQIGRLFDAL